jgi:hypothetical protein
VIVHLFLWKCACDSALVLVEVFLFATNESNIGAVPVIKSAQCTFTASQGYPILPRVPACGVSQVVTSLARDSNNRI